MASNTKNVKLGVCSVLFNGADLGFTQGGVEVTVSTDTHDVNIDQFGTTVINQLITGRKVMAKVPLAETTLEQLAGIMPGSTFTQTGGGKATGTITIATNPTNGQTIVVNGVTFAFKTTATSPTDVVIGAAAANTATNLASTLNAYGDPAIANATYSAATSVVTATFRYTGVEGNAFTLANGTAGASVTFSGSTLTGGIEPTSAQVNVTTAVGQDLLSIAKELRLHPTNKPYTDRSDDFVIPLAATAGALQFAYKVDVERIYNIEFMGFPDNSGRLFKVGA